jgi:CRP-like cAMP-binding protein
MLKKNRSETDLIKERIAASSVFKELPDSDLRALLRIAHVRDYSAGEKIFTEGTVGLCFYIIVKGSVSMLQSDSPDAPSIRELGEGDIFSEIHLFTESIHSVTAVAKDLTKLIIFAKPDIEDLVKINPKPGNRILLRFLDCLATRLDEVYKENRELKLLTKM